VPNGSFGLPFKDDIAALLYAYFFLWTPIYARFRGFSEGCKENIIYFNLGNPSSPRLLFTPVSWHCHPLHMTTSASTPTLISSVPELQPLRRRQTTAILLKLSLKIQISPNAFGIYGTMPTHYGLFTMSVSLALLTSNS
jgi:hypothetical protein